MAKQSNRELDTDALEQVGTAQEGEQMSQMESGDIFSGKAGRGRGEKKACLRRESQIKGGGHELSLTSFSGAF